MGMASGCIASGTARGTSAFLVELHMFEMREPVSCAVRRHQERTSSILQKLQNTATNGIDFCADDDDRWSARRNRDEVRQMRVKSHGAQFDPKLRQRNRRLAHDHLVIRKARGRKQKKEFGEFYLFDTESKAVIEKHVDPNTFRTDYAERAQEAFETASRPKWNPRVYGTKNHVSIQDWDVADTRDPDGLNNEEDKMIEGLAEQGL